MPSFNIHLAVGKRYIEKHPTEISDMKAFNYGLIAPDLVENKRISHYSGTNDRNNLVEYLKEKVRLDYFLASETIETDYQKGVFLHLITDEIYFNQFFEKEYITQIAYDNFIKDQRYSYQVIGDDIDKKYNLDYQELQDAINKNLAQDRKEHHIKEEVRTNILPLSKVEQFIEQVSDINLEVYQENIKTKIKQKKKSQ